MRLECSLKTTSFLNFIGYDQYIFSHGFGLIVACLCCQSSLVVGPMEPVTIFLCPPTTKATVIGSGHHGTVDNIFLSLKNCAPSPSYNRVRSGRKCSSSNYNFFLLCIYFAAGTWLLSCCLAMDVSVPLLKICCSSFHTSCHNIIEKKWLRLKMMVKLHKFEV